MSSEASCKAVLGLAPSASKDDIKKAYRRLVLQCHPDKVVGRENQFRQIDEAYRFLMRPRASFSNLVPNSGNPDDRSVVPYHDREISVEEILLLKSGIEPESTILLLLMRLHLLCSLTFSQFFVSQLFDSIFCTPPIAKGKIHGIWFTQPNGLLHPAVKTNFSGYVSDAKANNFELILWTNLKELTSSEVEALTERGVVVQDHSICKSSQFYPYFLHFLDLGIAGDKAAFALASDIFRMAILELTPEDEYYIYMDPNDTRLLNLGQDLSSLGAMFSYNSFGYSFHITKLDSVHFHVRNDVLIAAKAINPKFFEAYLSAYAAQLEANYLTYKTPKIDREAQQFANTITLQTGSNLFAFMLNGLVTAKFGEFGEAYPIVHNQCYLSYERDLENCNTWLPVGDLADEKKMLEELGVKFVDRPKVVPAQPPRISAMLPFFGRPQNDRSQAELSPTLEETNWTNLKVTLIVAAMFVCLAYIAFRYEFNLGSTQLGKHL